jgi:AcrR family transcriptional regulator
MVRSDTRERLLRAALTLVAEGGLRAVTHRALENAAGVSRGSTTYHLGNRQQIMEAILEYLADLDATDLQTMLQSLALLRLSAHPLDLEELIRRTVRVLLAQPERVIARYTLMLEAARDESLRPIVRRWRSVFAMLPEPLFIGLDTPDPAAAARGAVALMDGMIFEHLATGEPDLEERLSRALTRFALGQIVPNSVPGTPSTRPGQPFNVSC